MFEILVRKKLLTSLKHIVFCVLPVTDDCFLRLYLTLFTFKALGINTLADFRSKSTYFQFNILRFFLHLPPFGHFHRYFLYFKRR